MRHLGKTVLNGLLLGAAAGALTVGFVSKSHAGALAFSSLNIANFQILKSDGTQWDASEFDVLEIGDFSKAESSLNGSGTVATHPSDVPMQCQGNCAGIGQNDGGRQGGPLGQFSRADAVLTGAGITGVQGTPNEVNALSVAEIQLNQVSIATAGSNVGTGSRFSFVPGEDGSLTFRFDATALLEAMLEQDDVMAFASIADVLTITEEGGPPIVIWSPDGQPGSGPQCNGDDPTTVEDENATCQEISDPFSLNTSIATLDGGDGLVTYDPDTGTFEMSTPILSAGKTYTLSISQETAVNAEVAVAPVPEPAAAGLLGLGMLGLVGLRRRWSKN